jgi:hypothetical protein
MVKDMNIVHWSIQAAPFMIRLVRSKRSRFDFAHRMCFVELTYRKQFPAPRVTPGILDIIEIHQRE